MKISNQQLIFGVVVIFLFSAITYVILESPAFLPGQVAAIRVGTGEADYFYITSNQFTCTPQAAGQTDCTFRLEGSSLHASIHHTPGMLLDCAATYAGESVPCQPRNFVGNASRFSIHLDSDLGISPERMAELRAQHPLLYWQESTWQTAVNAIAFAAIIMVIAIVWIFRPHQVRMLTQLAKSSAVVVLGGALYVGSILGLIALGYMD